MTFFPEFSVYTTLMAKSKGQRAKGKEQRVKGKGRRSRGSLRLALCSVPALQYSAQAQQTFSSGAGHENKNVPSKRSYFRVGDRYRVSALADLNSCAGAEGRKAKDRASGLGWSRGQTALD